MSTKAEESKADICRKLLVESCSLILEEWHCQNDDEIGIVLSGGVDTAAVVEALTSLGKCPKNAVTVYVGDKATDIPYASAIAKKHGITNHVEIRIGPDELLDETLEMGVKVLATFDPMELRNSIVVGRALREAKKLGLKYLFTGDGSDELLGGYSFTHQSEDPLWTEKRNQMCASWFFSAPIMAKSLGISAASPFCHDHFKQYAIDHLHKVDCIGERQLESYPGEERTTHVTGKIPLREAFPDSLSAWRRKDPIEVGSGSTLLGKNNGEYFDKKIPSEELLREKQAAAKEHKIVIRNAEHCYYFKVFKKVFPTVLNAPYQDDSEKSMLPSRPLDGNNDECIGCRFLLRSAEAKFCKVCGAWPARKQSTCGTIII